MGETANIAAMAERISGQLFNVFGWRSVGPVNFNFQENESPEKQRRSKHPCDVIFEYLDPFCSSPIYLLTDLKSYAKSTIEDKSRIKSAITSLGKSLRAAVNSDEFQKRLPGDGGKISALFFVYNNDDDYDKDFEGLLSANMPSPLDIPLTASLYIFGPSNIRFLLDVYNDLQKVYGESDVSSGRFRFYYPNLVSKVPDKNEWHTATPEMLLSPYIPVIYDKEVRMKQEDGSCLVTQKKQIQLYYRGPGSTYEEFCFILDYLFRYSIIDDCASVSIRIPGANGEYLSAFEKAKDEFSQHFYTQDQVFKKLSVIECKSIMTQSQKFSEIELGMEKRKEFKDAAAEKLS